MAPWFASDGSVLAPCDTDAAKWAQRRSGKRVLIHEAGHSEPEHALAFSYLTYCWRDKFQEQYPEPDDFREMLSVAVGHYETKTFEIEGQRVRFFKVKSWSFAKSHYDEFHALIDRCEAWLTAHGCCDLETFHANRAD